LVDVAMGSYVAGGGAEATVDILANWPFIDKDFVTLARRDCVFLRPPTPRHPLLASLLYQQYGGQEEISEWPG